MASGVFSTLRQVALALGFAIMAAVIAIAEKSMTYSKAFALGMLTIGFFVVVATLFVYLFIPSKKPA